MGRVLNPFDTSPRAFISYARSDGEEIARSLRSRLEQEHPQITLWLDRARMIGGLGWWKQITEALDRVEILIMVLTPGALHAGVAAKEWRYARQQGVRVCPVAQDASALSLTELPSWMRKAHCYDLTREWELFVAYLYSPGKDNRVPFMAPDIPDGCVERAAELQSVLSRLLDDSRENAVAVTTALHGAGGFGKTTLACMLCHHENVINAFDDGILWVNLGEVPNVQGELTKLYAALTGERPPFVDIDDASIQVASRLDQKNCLLVIDDVWDPNHVKPFMRGGNQCARVITTRQLSIVSEIGVSKTSIDRMTGDEALQLLTARMPSYPENLGALHALAERLGHWPLLLKLAGSQLRERMERGDSSQGALTYMERAMDKRGVVAFDRAGRRERGDAVATTVNASLELFPPADQARCAQLAIFPSDRAFPLSAACAIWDLDALDSETLMIRLADAALLEFDLKTANVRLHSVLRSYFEARIDSPQALHARLADRWLRNPCGLPDAYAWTWIGWHLAQASQLDRLRKLLLDFDWLKLRLRAAPVQVTLQDFELAGGSDGIKLIRDALSLAVHGLSFDSGQLRVQLRGRIDRGRCLSADQLLDQADASEPRPRLSLSDTTLTHPGGALTGIVKAHGGAIEALALSPNGRWILSGSQDWTLRLWDLETNSVVRTFEGHQGTVHAVAFTPDGQAILSGCEDRTVRIWDVATGHMRQLFRGHSLAVRGIAIAADGRLAYSASEDGTIREWNLLTKATRTLFTGRNHQLGPLAVTANGRQLIFSAGDWTIRVMDLVDIGATRRLEGHSGVVRSLALAPDDSTLISGGDDGAVRAWTLGTGEPVLELHGHSGSVEALAFTPSGRHAVSGSRDRTLRLWDLEAGTALQVLQGHSGFVRAVAISSPARVVSGSTDGTIRHWNVASHSVDRAAEGHNEAVSRLALSMDGSHAISGSGGSDLLLWQTERGYDECAEGTHPEAAAAAHVAGRLEGHTGRIQAIDLTADGRLAVTGSRDKTVRIWDLGLKRATHILKGHAREIVDLQISADGDRIASFSRDRTVRIWDVRTGQALRVLVSEDNDRARASLSSSNAMIAELETGPIVDLTTKPIPLNPSIAFSPDGSCLVLASQGSVCVWNLRTGTMDNRELGDVDIVAIDFDSSSQCVLMGSLFGPLLLWRLGQDDPVLLEGHSGKVLDVVVGPGGHSAVSAASDDTICIWDLDAARLKRHVQGGHGRADACVIARSGNLAYAIYGDTLVAYDVMACTCIGSLSLDHQITAVSVTPTGALLAVGDLSGRVHFLSLEK